MQYAPTVAGSTSIASPRIFHKPKATFTTLGFVPNPFGIVTESRPLDDGHSY